MIPFNFYSYAPGTPYFSSSQLNLDRVTMYYKIEFLMLSDVRVYRHRVDPNYSYPIGYDSEFGERSKIDLYKLVKI